MEDIPAEREAFPTPFGIDYWSAPPPHTALERRMMEMSRAIRSKVDWREKLHDPAITSTWKSEAMEQGLSEAAINYVLKELQYYMSLDSNDGTPSPVDGVWMRKNCLDAESVEELRNTIYRTFEDVPEEKKDYHPGSNGTVIDLVHPSLYCYVHSVTHTITGRTCSEVDRGCEYCFGKSSYQWIPTNVMVDEAGMVKFANYINNIHPEKQKSMYPILEKVLACFIPLFERVLTDLLHPRPHRLDLTDHVWGMDEVECPINRDTSDHEEEYSAWRREREVPLPPIPEFEPPPPVPRFSLRGRRLQVITKLATIVLTPEKPTYGGGTWHIEGTWRESIVATGIYYYQIENISESRLQFRRAVQDPCYNQDDVRGVKVMFDYENGATINESLGSLTVHEGLFASFPNFYQHYVSPFELKDKTKPGIRKIIVFFLVDPLKDVLSTDDIAPQQLEWYEDGLLDIPNRDQLMRWAMSFETAKDYRVDLMSERKYIRDDLNRELFEREFSLCEH